METAELVATLAHDLVRIDSRSQVSNLAVADRLQSELGSFEIERLDFKDVSGTNKCVLVAARGRAGLALCGHMDTVPETGWSDDPWSGAIVDGALHGLGSVDMKGPVASLIAAAEALPASVPIALLLTTDEETTKAGARLIAQRSQLARQFAPRGIVIAEPTGMVPVRGHRSHVEFRVTAQGVQAHSSGREGRNANWALVPFLNEMAELRARLETDRALQDEAYEPAISDFNPVIDNHGTAINVTVPRATVRIRYRYSARLDPEIVAGLVRAAAERHGLDYAEVRGAPPPELPATHELIQQAMAVTGRPAGTVPFGTDASELQALAPCVILGPGDIARAHTPQEQVEVEALVSAVPVFAALAERVASLAGD